MENRNIMGVCKTAVGTVFLLAGAAFVCSTLMSMRAVFADPIAPAGAAVATPQATRAGAVSRATARTSPRGSATTNTVSRNSATTTTTAPSRGVTARTTVSRTAAPSRTTAASTTNTRTAAPTRNVVARTTAANRTTVSNATRNVRNRINTARVSLQGNAIRGSKATTNTYTYLSNKLYTGNYSNIIDSTTGLISADAYNNCMESYYACMDEICTARNAAQRRCACAGRVKAFADAEAKLETANEELIKVSGELALLVASGGKDVSEAFRLTDAEKVMNCVSWKDVTSQYGVSSTEAKEWCYNHGIYGNDGGMVSTCSQPSYCAASGNNFGFDVANIDGNSSDILASLQSWAKAKENTLTILTEDNNNLTSAFENLSNVVSGLAGIGGALGTTEDLKDSLAETWGYELFEYAHNNVCNRVLDSCFNGIYEACGTPPSSGRRCGNGAAQCPYNYNSMISVSNTGNYELNFVTGNSGYTSSNSATCFGYTSASGDPYSNLRGPVADARRSILQKYALDANADCDAYGEQLRATAQNIGYQKVAAQQALQQKRLEFAQNERTTTRNDAMAATTNFNECLSEILDCYETQANSNQNWTTARIKTYCAQISNIPHCYETMVCNPSNDQFLAVIDKQDSESCTYSQDYTKNTCRNIVTLSDILNAPSGVTPTTCTEGEKTCNSVALREACLQQTYIEELRDWKAPTASGN